MVTLKLYLIYALNSGFGYSKLGQLFSEKRKLKGMKDIPEGSLIFPLL